MKKFVSVLVFILLLSSCSSGTKPYTFDDFSLHDSDKKAEIRLGMTRAEVEETLSASVSKDAIGLEEISGLTVCFRDDLLSFVAVRKLNEDLYPVGNYETNEGITINSTYDEFSKKYPGSARENNYLGLYLMKDGDSFTNISDDFLSNPSRFTSDEAAMNSIYHIGFGSNYTSDDAEPETIYIGKFKSIYTACKM